MLFLFIYLSLSLFLSLSLHFMCFNFWLGFNNSIADTPNTLSSDDDFITLLKHEDFAFRLASRLVEVFADAKELSSLKFRVVRTLILGMLNHDPPSHRVCLVFLCLSVYSLWCGKLVPFVFKKNPLNISKYLPFLQDSQKSPDRVAAKLLPVIDRCFVHSRDGKTKKFLYHDVQNTAIWHSRLFWEAHFLLAVEKDLLEIRSEGRSPEAVKTLAENAALAQLASSRLYQIHLLTPAAVIAKFIKQIGMRTDIPNNKIEFLCKDLQEEVFLFIYLFTCLFLFLVF